MIASWRLERGSRSKRWISHSGPVKYLNSVPLRICGTIWKLQSISGIQPTWNNWTKSKGAGADPYPRRFKAVIAAKNDSNKYYCGVSILIPDSAHTHTHTGPTVCLPDVKLMNWSHQIYFALCCFLIGTWIYVYISDLSPVSCRCSLQMVLKLCLSSKILMECQHLAYVGMMFFFFQHSDSCDLTSTACWADVDYMCDLGSKQHVSVFPFLLKYLLKDKNGWNLLLEHVRLQQNLWYKDGRIIL